MMMNAADTDVTFSDMNFSEQKLVGRSDSHPKSKNGYFVTKRKAIIIVLLVVLLCIIIGVIVHYAKRCDNKTASMLTTPAPQEAATTPKPTETLDIRLPGSITPVHYDIQIRPDIYGDNPENFKFSGSVIITVDVKSSTDDIILHSNKLTIQKESIKVRLHGASDHIPVDLDGIELIPNPHQFLKIPMKSSLEAGKTYHVEISFSGKIENDLRGIYYSSYTNPDVPDKPV